MQYKIPDEEEKNDEDVGENCERDNSRRQEHSRLSSRYWLRNRLVSVRQL